ncbi:cysteine desulfurase NifS [Chloroflexota bacterium]
MNRIYLDHAATTPAHPKVVKAMLPYFSDEFANPSGLYSCAHEAKAAIEAARRQVAALIGATAEEIFFTSTGTEADNFALKGIAYGAPKKNHVITTTIEHHAIMETSRFLEKRGVKVTYLPVNGYGLVDPDIVKKAITPSTTLISVMAANNEIGTTEPIAEIGKIAREAGVYLHTDAVQVVGHLPVSVGELNVDLLSMSAHKLYGPKGVGALYIRKGTRITPFQHGGGQERERRAGTENVPGIVGFGKAAELARQEMGPEIARLVPLRDRLIKGILKGIDHCRLNGHPTKRLPNNVSVSIDFVEGESLCLGLDGEGICASTGSACSSGSGQPSHVLQAIGLTRERAHGCLRFSLGRQTTEVEIAQTLATLSRIVARLRAMSPLAKRGA